MSDDGSNFARDIILSLPPMEPREWNMTKADLTKLGLYCDDVAKERNAKLCAIDVVENPANPANPLSDSLKTAMKDHQEQQYKAKATVTARSSVSAEEDGSIVVRSYAEHLAAHNCTTGSWLANFVVTPGEGEVEMTGKVELHVYYYEGGVNVQMRATREFPATKLESSAPVIVEKISEWEKELYNQLSSMFADGEIDCKLKKIRRILPITRTRFKWDAAAQASVKLLNARSNE